MTGVPDPAPLGPQNGGPTRAVLVTGGSRGIGRGIVNRLVGDGFRVVTCGRGPRPEDLTDDVHWVRCDLAVTGQAEFLVAEARKVVGPVDVLVNNAGVLVARTVLDSTDADWDLLVGTNCRGLFEMCRAVLPEMTDPRGRGGVIVNIGSISGDVADPMSALYNASKAFVHGLTRSIAVDHGPRVRCNTVAPGWVETGMADEGFDVADDPAAARSNAMASHPVGRMGRPADIAGMVAWLVSDEAAFATGQCFTVDGGLTAASPVRPDLT